TEVNEGVVKQYMKQLGAIAKGEEVHLLEMALRLPDAMKTGRDEIDVKDYEAILEALRNAIDKLNSYRNEEGEVLEKEFAERMDEMTNLLDRVKEMDPERLGSIRPRLQKAAEDLKTEIDENRFEQELMYYLEKYDITEEKLRLQNHLSYFTETMRSAQSNGKKLGFISQEIGREINTIGSKANYAPMQQLVVQMKDSLEKVKEQMLNVL
ncbi:MAG: DUF1732 domain-containing protein, partial [Flavobacteriaceae bacterium]